MSKREEIPGFPLTASELNAILFYAYSGKCDCPVCQKIKSKIDKMVKKSLEVEATG